MSKRTHTCPLIVEYNNSTFGWFPLSYERNPRLATRKMKDALKYHTEVRIVENPEFIPHNLWKTQ